jgi:hypothetical protein
MKRAIIISISARWVSACRRYLREKGILDIKSLDLGGLANRAKNSASCVNSGEIVDLYRHICGFLYQQEIGSMEESLGILDLGFGEEDLRDIQPIRYDAGNAELAGMLSMTFPEVHWVLYSVKNVSESSRIWYWASDIDGILSSDWFPELFDPYGVRNEMRVNSNNIFAIDHSDFRLPTRETKRRAIVIDEEEAYAYFHSYILYRLGYLCYTVTDYRRMQLLKEDCQTPISPEVHIDASIEDIFLNFSDQPKNENYSNISHRDRNHVNLKKAMRRIFVTSGHKNNKWDDENERYFGQLRAQGRIVKKVYKPSGGIFNLIIKAGFEREYRKKLKEDRKKLFPRAQVTESGIPIHSAPGKLLVIAERLIERADKIFSGAKSVRECVQGAILALEAQEVLGYRTPTTSLEALALRHKLEVKAECMFYGVGYNIDVRSRVKEIRADIRLLSRWCHPSVKYRTALNANLTIVTEIMKIFRDYSQFDEEQACLKQLRTINRKWFYANNPAWAFTRPIRAYTETIVGSVALFSLALLGWPLIGGLISKMAGAAYGSGVDTLPQHIMNSIFTFFGLQPVVSPINSAAMGITVGLVVVGFLHLGIFVSYVYTLLTRK